MSTSIARKIVSIMADIGRIPKHGVNPHFGYRFVRESDVVETIRELLVKHQLAIVPACTSTNLVFEKESSKNGPVVAATLSFTLLDAESGESLTIPFIGFGQDAGDKGLYKALTGGQKYFLLKLFCIPTGDDPEQQEHDAPPPPATFSPPRPAAEPPRRPDPQRLATARAALAEGERRGGMPPAPVTERQLLALQNRGALPRAQHRFEVRRLEDLTKQQASDLLDDLMSRRS